MVCGGGAEVTDGGVGLSRPAQWRPEILTTPHNTLTMHIGFDILGTMVVGEDMIREGIRGLFV